MFGLSRREILIKVIKNACVNELPIYEKSVREYLNMLNENPKISDDDDFEIIKTARYGYLNAVCNSVMDSLALSSPAVYARFRLARMEPQITGFPFSAEYLCDNGISAGTVFGFAYFSLTEKSVNTVKLSRTMSMLSHYQNNLMNLILEKIDREMSL